MSSSRIARRPRPTRGTLARQFPPGALRSSCGPWRNSEPTGTTAPATYEPPYEPPYEPNCGQFSVKGLTRDEPEPTTIQSRPDLDALAADHRSDQVRAAL